MSYLANIEEETVNNYNFRKVLYTAKDLQLVVMCLNPGEDIGREVHDLDQFIRIEKGYALVEINNKSEKVRKDSIAIIKAGSYHNVTNISKTKTLHLYTLYSRPTHKKNCLQRSKEDIEC